MTSSTSEIQPSETLSDKRRRKKEIAENYLFYEDRIRDCFGVVSVIMFIVIAIVIKSHSKNFNYFDKQFYDSCNADPGFLSMTEVFELDRQIDTYKDDITRFKKMSSRDPIWGKEKALNLEFYEKYLNEYVKDCNEQLILREPCYAEKLKKVTKMHKQIFYFVVFPYFVSAILAIAFLVFCYKNLVSFSHKKNYILDTLHTKKYIGFISFLIAVFGFLLLFQYGNYNISVNDVPVVCGEGSKYLYEECYYESKSCYSISNMSISFFFFQDSTDFFTMYFIYGPIALLCFLANRHYHTA